MATSCQFLKLITRPDEVAEVLKHSINSVANYQNYYY
jgi:hypothetical protein